MTYIDTTPKPHYRSAEDPLDPTDVIRAIQYAEKHSRGRTRSGGSEVPELTHLLEVSELAGRATNGNLLVLVAAVLHDSVELAAEKAIIAGLDPVAASQIAYAEIAEQFGQDVADLVMENTDDSRLSKKEQKAAQLANMPHKSREGQIIKIADAYSNTCRLHLQPPDWSRASIIGYARSRRALHEAARGTSKTLDFVWDMMWKNVSHGLKIQD